MHLSAFLHAVFGSQSQLSVGNGQVINKNVHAGWKKKKEWQAHGKVELLVPKNAFILQNILKRVYCENNKWIMPNISSYGPPDHNSKSFLYLNAAV